MAVFGGAKSVQTVGAGKSGATDKRRYGPDSTLFYVVVCLVMALVAPVALVMFLLLLIASLTRRVRVSRLAAVAALVTLVALTWASTHGGITMLLTWYVQGFVGVWSKTGIAEKAVSALNLLVDVPQPDLTRRGIIDSLIRSAPLTAPIGAWLGTWLAGWMGFRRAALSDLEGKRYDFSRPEGFLDHRRAKKNTARIAAGRCIDHKRETVAIGVGRYGKPLSMNVGTLLRPTLVFGGPRQGKTRLTLSVLGQIARLGPSGFIVLDFKGDGEVPEFWARCASAVGRPFLHFQPTDKNDRVYVKPHESAPDHPAFYDPLMRGNATSKADMIVNSVPREGDAMAYFRAQYEYVQVVFQVAHLTRFDTSIGGFNTLMALLDPDRLQKQAMSVNPDTGRGWLADHQGLLERVNSYVSNMKKDDIQRGAIMDAARTLSTHVNGPAVGPFLRPAPTGMDGMNIDLVDAIRSGKIVVFSLSTQDYGDLARMVGNLILLDLNNAIAELRSDLTDHRREVGDPDSPTPWAPAYVEIEEFSAVGSEEVLGVLNKAGDVNVRGFLSSQSWYDIVTVDGTGTFARQVLDQAGNVISFGLNDGEAAKVLADLTPPQTKHYARTKKEFSGGPLSLFVKAANTGDIDPMVETESAATGGDFQSLRRFHFLWFAKEPTPRITHTFTAGPNHWVEPIAAVQVAPDAGPVDLAGDGVRTSTTPPAAPVVPGPLTVVPDVADKPHSDTGVHPVADAPVRPRRKPAVVMTDTAWGTDPQTQPEGFGFDDKSLLPSLPPDVDDAEQEAASEADIEGYMGASPAKSVADSDGMRSDHQTVERRGVTRAAPTLGRENDNRRSVGTESDRASWDV